MALMKKIPRNDTTTLYDEVVTANKLYTQTYNAQPYPFALKRAVLLTCMDARILTHNIMGFQAGDMYVIRNAGGRASDDAIRSLVIASRLLKADQFFVMHHTECGMQRFTDTSMNELLGARKTAKINYCSAILKKRNNFYAKVGKECLKKASMRYECIDWLTIQNGLFKSVLEDVQKIRNHPLILKDIPIYGFIFDVLTGALVPVEEAIKIGQARKKNF